MLFCVVQYGMLADNCIIAIFYMVVTMERSAPRLFNEA